ncbi:MAG TPA: rhomboid family intramembrane serine protease [Longimicrobiales bacterium]|nr:rhomboid family intramembrane serine protease [Longimicrobiales bacterium]
MVIPIGDDNTGRHITPLVTYGLIATNLAVWLFQLTAGEDFTYGYSTVPLEITQGTDLTSSQSVTVGGQTVTVPHATGPSPIQLTLLTSMFMHASWMHFLGNMVYLWIFGDNVEDHLGHVRFLFFYLMCGFAATLAMVFAAPDSIIPGLGASGAIAGVLGAYLIKFPKSPVRVLMMRAVTTVPAFVAIGLWVLLQIFGQISVAGGQAGGVAYLAHIGGFVAGVILIMIFGRSLRKPATA